MNAYEKLRSEMDAEQQTVDWKAKCTELNAENTALKGTIEEYVHKVRDLETIVRLLLYRKSIHALDWKNIASIDHMLTLNINSYDTNNRISRDVLYLCDNQVQHLYEHHKLREDVFNRPGSCPFAAALAFTYFSTYHAVMKPKRVKGVLRCHDPHEQLVMTNGKTPECDADILPKMRAYALSPNNTLSGAIHGERSCIWKWVNDLSFDSTEEKGASHEIIELTMVTGEHILVDFSIGQFTIIPDSCMLLVSL
jgi:hypothetical protein